LRLPKQRNDLEVIKFNRVNTFKLQNNNDQFTRLQIKDGISEWEMIVRKMKCVQTGLRRNQWDLRNQDLL
jgi:hypothetical protein